MRRRAAALTAVVWTALAGAACTQILGIEDRRLRTEGAGGADAALSGGSPSSAGGARADSGPHPGSGASNSDSGPPMGSGGAAGSGGTLGTGGDTSLCRTKFSVIAPNAACGDCVCSGCPASVIDECGRNDCNMLLGCVNTSACRSYTECSAHPACAAAFGGPVKNMSQAAVNDFIACVKGPCSSCSTGTNQCTTENARCDINGLSGGICHSGFCKQCMGAPNTTDPECMQFYGGTRICCGSNRMCSDCGVGGGTGTGGAPGSCPATLPQSSCWSCLCGSCNKASFLLCNTTMAAQCKPIIECMMQTKCQGWLECHDAPGACKAGIDANGGPSVKTLVDETWTCLGSCACGPPTGCSGLPEGNPCYTPTNTRGYCVAGACSACNGDQHCVGWGPGAACCGTQCGYGCGAGGAGGVGGAGGFGGAGGAGPTTVANNESAFDIVALPGWVAWLGGTPALGRVVSLQEGSQTRDAFAPNEDGPHALATNGSNRVFWFNGAGDLFSFDLISRSRTTLTTGETGAIDLAVSGNLLYWTNIDGTIRSAPVGGGTAQPVAAGPASPGAIAVANGMMYWTIPGPPGMVEMAPTLNGSITRINTPANVTPTEIIVSGSNVYFLQVGGTNGTVQVMPAGGGASTTATGTQTYGALGGLAADASGIYFTAAGPTGVYLAVSPATPPTLLSNLTPPPAKLAINNTFVYFIDASGSKIQQLPK